MILNFFKQKTLKLTSLGKSNFQKNTGLLIKQLNKTFITSNRNFSRRSPITNSVSSNNINFFQRESSSFRFCSLVETIPIEMGMSAEVYF